MTKIAPRLSRRSIDTLGAVVLTLFSSNVVHLKQGMIQTRANPEKATYTILLVGETGVGKSSLLQFIANALHGNGVDHYDFDILDHTNEQGGSNSQSQTNSARIYEFTSKNGLVVRASVSECGE